MIKLQDFAREQGVTDRAIQKHLKKYEAELEGLFERKGPNGTWLTDEACEFLRSKMVTPPPPVLFSEDPRVERLETKVAELEGRLEKKEAMLTVAQEQVQEAQRNVNTLQAKAEEHRLLEAANQSLQRDVEDLKRSHRDEIDRKDVEIRAAQDKIQDQARELQIAAENVVKAEDARKAAEAKLAAIRDKQAEIKRAPFHRRKKLKRELEELWKE